MVMSKAKTVDQYLDELPEDRRKELEGVLKVLRKEMPKGYLETVGSGMLTWVIPLEAYPKTYNGQPLCYAGLAAQKNGFSLYLMGAYLDPAQTKQIEEAFDKAGKKLDMGKSCIRFRRAGDLPLPALGKVIASMPPKKYIERYEAAKGK